MIIREKIEKFENLTLVPQAFLSSKTTGREYLEEEDPIRTCFMVDRDRILHSKSFRRLKHKTQVYIKTFGDHYRTRLTHTLEVAQIGRTIGVGLGLNENLIEAIALGHDLGHVAFAHNGEEVLNEFLDTGFKHNEQSVRIVKKLERDGKGLNLTNEVIDGILNHSGLGEYIRRANTLEGRIVQYSDKIAYLNHDIDDSIRAGILSENDLPKEVTKVLGGSHSQRIEILITDMIKETEKNFNANISEIRQSAEVKEAMVELRKFMFSNVYLGEVLKGERDKAKFILIQLIEYYCKNKDKLPRLYQEIATNEGLERAVADYIAGMSDDYCIGIFNEIFVPKFVIF